MPDVLMIEKLRLSYELTGTPGGHDAFGGNDGAGL